MNIAGEPPLIHQHPLAYLLALEGIALLRAFAGEYDRDFTLARLDEIRGLLDAAVDLGDRATVAPIAPEEGYRSWADFYDEAANQLVDLEQPVVWEILDGLPRGVALDAACGTGRHTARLASLGHTVIGVDTSAAMLGRARAKVPGGAFHAADQRGLIPGIGVPVVKARSDGSPGYMPIRTRLTSDYLAAALPLGLQVRRCEEPLRPFPLVDDGELRSATGDEDPEHDPTAPPDIWALHSLAPTATNAAYRGSPAVLILHFQLDEPATERRRSA